MSKIYFLFFFFICTFCLHNKSTYNLSSTSSDSYGLLYSFYFKSGGFASFKVNPLSISETPFSIKLCKKIETNGIWDEITDNCPFVLIVEPENGEISNNFDIPYTSNFFAVLYAENRGKFNFDLETVFMNPGDEHLSYNLVPLKYTNIGITFGYFFLTVFWVANFIRHRLKARLHLAISLFPFVTGFAYAFVTIYYFEQSRTGDASGMFYVSRVFLALSDSLFLFLLLIIVQGYGVASSNIVRRNLIFIIVIGVLYFITSLLNYILGGFYSLFSLVIYLVSFYVVFKFTTKNLIALQNDETIENRNEKYFMFKSLEYVLFIYIFILFVISIVMFFSEYTISEWIPVFVHNLLDLILTLIILFTFRLRGKKR